MRHVPTCVLGGKWIVSQSSRRLPLWLPHKISTRKWEMDDVSAKISAANKDGEAAPVQQDDRPIRAIDCTTVEEHGKWSVPVTREEIAILRAFLSAEIDAIIYADTPLPRD